MMVLGALQVRLSSSRLPGKALMPILGRPMLSYQIERLRRSQRVNQWIIATSDDPSDAPLAEFAKAEGIGIFRGSLNDVLNRHCSVVRQYAPSHLLRVGGDCPLADWRTVDALAGLHLDGGFDFSSNAYPPSWPDGYDVEIFKSELLELLARETKLPSEREHISPYVAEANRNRFRVGNLTGGHGHRLRLTVDEPEDFLVISRIIERLYPLNPDFTVKDVLSLVAAEPLLVVENQHFLRNAGRAPSLESDRRFLEAQDAGSEAALP